jgi:TolB-like protein
MIKTFNPEKFIGKIGILIGAAYILLALSCVSADDVPNQEQPSADPAAPSPSSQPAPDAARAGTAEPFFTGDGGKGIVIAVPPPVMRNGTARENWMPQLFQDLVTGGLARYSAMTVLDRSNERLIFAEQELSLSGFYSDEDYIRIGNLTNARFIAAGSIQNVSGRYNVSFRINNTETNEIRTSFDKSYSIEDIEKGLAAKEAVAALLAGMGVELTAAGEKSLLAIPEARARSTARLAKGMAADKNDNPIEALAYFIQAVENDAGMEEASQYIQNFGVYIPTGSITEKANYALEQKTRWEKIFEELNNYLVHNLVIAVYDLSQIKDDFQASTQKFNFTVSPGVKIIPNRTVLLVWKKIMDTWTEIKNQEENHAWASSIRGPFFISGNEGSGRIFAIYNVEVGLYNDYGDELQKAIFSLTSSRFSRSYSLSYRVLSQKKYFDDESFYPIIFRNIPLADVTDTLTSRIESVLLYSKENKSIPIMSVAEWEQWLEEQ